MLRLWLAVPDRVDVSAWLDEAEDDADVEMLGVRDALWLFDWDGEAELLALELSEGEGT